MAAKKEYIAPRTDIVTMIQESPLMDFSKNHIDDLTDGKGIDIEFGKYAKYNNSSLWDSNNKGNLWE